MGREGFRSLLVWQRARDLAVTIYAVTRRGDLARDFSFCDQLRRAAVSVPSNIAEGDERDTDRDSVRFFYIAKGSLAELATQLEIASLIGYLGRDEWTRLDSEIRDVANMLGALTSHVAAGCSQTNC